MIPPANELQNPKSYSSNFPAENTRVCQESKPTHLVVGLDLANQNGKVLYPEGGIIVHFLVGSLSTAFRVSEGKDKRYTIKKYKTALKIPH